MNEAGQHVRRMRKKRGWTQTRLGIEVNVSTTSIWRIESGDLIPDDRLALDLANALRDDVDYLIALCDKDRTAQEAVKQGRKSRAKGNPMNSFEGALDWHAEAANTYRISGDAILARQLLTRLIARLKREIESPEHRLADTSPTAYRERLYRKLMWAMYYHSTLKRELAEDGNALKILGGTLADQQTVGQILEQNYGDSLGMSLYHLSRGDTLVIDRMLEEGAEELGQVTLSPDVKFIARAALWRNELLIMKELSPNEVEEKAIAVDKHVKEGVWAFEDLEQLCEVYEGLALVLRDINPSQALTYLQRDRIYLNQINSPWREGQYARTHLLLKQLLDTPQRRQLIPIREDIFEVVNVYPRRVSQLKELLS